MFQGDGDTIMNMERDHDNVRTLRTGDTLYLNHLCWVPAQTSTSLRKLSFSEELSSIPLCPLFYLLPMTFISEILSREVDLVLIVVFSLFSKQDIKQVTFGVFLILPLLTKWEKGGIGNLFLKQLLFSEYIFFISFLLNPCPPLSECLYFTIILLQKMY